MKVIVPEFVLSTLADRACDLLDSCELVVIDAEGAIEGDLEGAEVVMLPWAVPDATVAKVLGLPSLRWVHTVSAGIDHALEALPSDQEVVITNASGIFDVPIAEMVIAYMLTIAKRIPDFLDHQRNRVWRLLRLRELAGLTVGIVGLGNIGSEIAKRCKAMEMRVLATRRHPERGGAFADDVLAPERLRDLLVAAHFVVIAVPLTAETEGLIGRAELRMMRPDAWLINIARGAIVDEAALIETLTQGWIAGAALDVFEEEPLPESSPLWAMSNVMITPHSSWSTPYLKQREAELFLDNLERFLQDRPLRNVIDLSRGY
ncbi:MAG: D-2-hydroxyacid dehydrogenase [Anaerolineae bacterium]